MHPFTGNGDVYTVMYMSEQFSTGTNRTSDKQKYIYLWYVNVNEVYIYSGCICKDTKHIEIKKKHFLKQIVFEFDFVHFENMAQFSQKPCVRISINFFKKVRNRKLFFFKNLSLLKSFCVPVDTFDL